MPYDPQKHHRRSIRLKGYDYSQPGAYFVTICTWRRDCLFGEVVNGIMRLSPAGKIVQEQWTRLGQRFPQADFSIFVVMPNHIHGIVVMHDTGRGAGGHLVDPSPGIPPLRPYVIPGSLGAMLRAYKSAVAFRINALRGRAEPPVWQRNYYEHIVRNEAEWQRIVEYIQANPVRWAEDQLHPNAAPGPFNQESSHGK